MTNPFDQALNGYDEDGLEGIGKSLKKKLKKIKKAVKKVAKPIVKIHKKVASAVGKVHREAYRGFKRKLLPDKVERAVVKIEKSPITKAVAIGAASWFAGPLVLSSLSSMSPAAASIISKTGFLTTKGSLTSHLAKTAGKAAVKQYAGKKISKVQRKKQQKVQAAMLREEQQRVNAEIEADLRSIVDDPAFVGMAKKMLEQGKPIEEIVNTWVNSDAYKASATVAASGAVYPAAYDELVNAGADPDQAATLAEGIAGKMGADAATEVKQQTTGNLGKVALITIPIILTAMGG